MGVYHIILSHIRVVDFNGKLDSFILTLETLAHIKNNKAPKYPLLLLKSVLNCMVLLDSLSRILKWLHHCQMSNGKSSRTISSLHLFLPINRSLPFKQLHRLRIELLAA